MSSRSALHCMSRGCASVAQVEKLVVREEAAKRAWKAAHRRWFKLQDAGTWPVIRSPLRPQVSAPVPATVSAAQARAALAQAAHARLRQKHAAKPHMQEALAAAKGGAAAARHGAAVARLEEVHAQLAAAGAAGGEQLD